MHQALPRDGKARDSMVGLRKRDNPQNCV